MGRFIVVGDLMTDVVTRVMGPITLGTDTPSKVESYGGGSGANVAAWLGRQGQDVVYIGRRGPDVVGR
ncbi:MAG: carbohydrate kinase family protein, partial [Acidothermales bacterium]|nr:carbohydrate kinase family protein [Acidothermales bacterium]